MPELIYYVDKNDVPTGETSEKYAAHTLHTKLHAAFSIYIFNENGQVLVTQRAFSKKVWPGVWTNSCCGHPGPGESRPDAIKRRLLYELGMTAKNIQVILPHYMYKTPAFNGIIEHEYCPVYIGIATSEPVINTDEVEQYKWVDWNDFVSATSNDESGNAGVRSWMNKLPQGESRTLGIWSWWCKDQLKQINSDPDIKEYIRSYTSF